MLAWALTLALFAGASAKSFRIVGGEVTTIENFPSTVQIEFNTQSGVWDQNCGGVILTSRYVLSSAFCLRQMTYDSRTTRIRAGATYRNVGGTIHYIDYVVIHPTYIITSYHGDIGLAKTINPFVFSPAVQRTAIPTQGSVIPDNLPVTQVGWGRIEYGGAFSEALRYVNVLTMNYELCSEIYRPNMNFPPMSIDWLCTGLLDVDFKGSCHGDFGGPLYYGNLTIGIIYSLSECDFETENNSTYPSLNTNVAHHTQWIIDNAV
ncbi:unnamed protein product [Euphydryas editha]|uniref:Peptidase S1 domain-containing protein n=1 Tax=Euphydryas editha TaxID=104508 RepID=A0AAU9U7D8_EUPED|nr:unnamed protein product [Euphydryas editha]